MNTPRHITELLDTFTDVWADMAVRRELERREQARRILADRLVRETETFLRQAVDNTPS